MVGIKDYFLSVIASATICFIAISLTDKKGVISQVIKMICGLFMIIAVVSPLRSFRFDNLNGYFNDITQRADDAVLYGESLAQEEMTAIIKEQVEAYILDKATAFRMDVRVEVGMSESNPPVPEKVMFKGNVSPYEKRRMEQIVSQELGIAKENQLWE